MCAQRASSHRARQAALSKATVRRGDILVIAAEEIVGIASASPAAITLAHGDLDSPAFSSNETVTRDLRLDHVSIRDAIEDAFRHGFPVQEQYLPFAGRDRAIGASESVVNLTADEILAIAEAINFRVQSLEALIADDGHNRPSGQALRAVVARLRSGRAKIVNASV